MQVYFIVKLAMVFGMYIVYDKVGLMCPLFYLSDVAQACDNKIQWQIKLKKQAFSVQNSNSFNFNRSKTGFFHSGVSFSLAICFNEKSATLQGSENLLHC